MTASVGVERVGGIEEKEKRTHGHGQQCGDCWGRACMKGLSGNGNIQCRLNKKIKNNMESF